MIFKEKVLNMLPLESINTENIILCSSCCNSSVNKSGRHDDGSCERANVDPLQHSYVG